jgi:ribosomal protein L29
MALIRAKDAAKMDRGARDAKMKELKLELVKANVTANKASAKTKEIKRAIARLMTLNKSQKEELRKK